MSQAVLRRSLGLRDVVLFLITTGVNLQWVATAAAAGPGALVVWFIACAVMYVPLAVCVVELSSRYPQEGGLYVWSRRAFGDFGGFITGWTYWTSNLPYFPAVLYFAAGNALFAAGERWRFLSDSGAYFIAASMLGLGLATALNVAGLDVGKWLNNAGAVSRWLATLLLVAIGAAAWLRLGSATEWSAATLTPGLRLKDLMLWSTIAFALTGLEAASFMGEEIEDARRTVVRGIFAAAPIITLIYVLGTASVLVALPARDVSGLQGVMQAISKAEARIGLSGLTPVAAVLITLSALGSVGAWLGAVARIPFVAGIDHFLPEGFGRLHPRWGSPHVALLTQSAIAAVFIVLGQAGTSVKGAYDALVSMTIIAYFIPYLFLFAAAIKLQGAGPGALRIPGGRPATVFMAALGFATTAGSIVLSLFPAQDEPNKPLAVAKVVGLTLLPLGSGIVAYALGRRRASRHAAARVATAC